ncbi:MAG: aminotransferase class III-fold pyridoxal phosphate-dependent enzyme [Chlamydiota bacterium]|nr:aminotransferase class III-fold pyridoxal phosphate-dependent enzyme [Chlamydiota bacterium]
MSKTMKKKNTRSELVSSKLTNDPRIAEAKGLILSAIEEHQKEITGIKPANPTMQQSYENTISSFGEVRGGALWYPYIGSGIGNGPLVELKDGSVKYDFISGIGVHYWGHSHPDLIQASIDAAISNTIMQGHLQQNDDSIELSRLLLNNCQMDHCFLTTSGAMANENALKIAFQKNHPASRVLAFEGCFAGRTLAISQITDKPLYRDGLPDTLNVDYVPFYDESNPTKSTENALKILKQHIARYPRQHAVMIFEMVQGEGGIKPGTHAFFKTLMEELRSHGIAILVDEVQSFGRTPQLFACQHFNVEEYVDIITIGKLSQICATLFRKEFKPKPGLLSQTFTGSTTVIRAGLEIISSLVEGNYYGETGKIQEFHHYFAKHLERLSQKYPSDIEGPWGIGAMIAFTPFQGDKKKVLQFTHDLFEAGVISFVAGSSPMRVRFLIPIGAIEKSDIDTVAEILEKTIKQTK